jgi:hypothetical protein
MKKFFLSIAIVMTLGLACTKQGFPNPNGCPTIKFKKIFVDGTGSIFPIISLTNDSEYSITNKEYDSVMVGMPWCH